MLQAMAQVPAADAETAEEDESDTKPTLGVGRTSRRRNGGIDAGANRCLACRRSRDAAQP